MAFEKMENSLWIAVGDASAVTEDTPLSARIDGTAVGVYRLGDSFYALEDVCPHADALLSQGFVDGDVIECPLHGAQFHIPSGKCLKGPGGRDLVKFETRIDGAQIFIRKND